MGAYERQNIRRLFLSEKKDFLRQQQRATSKPGTNDADFVGKPEESRVITHRPTYKVKQFFFSKCGE